ncbi:hypothetical protein PENARI_c001G05191 [Penicillium arizonense]|uniref:Uncharacterized protein n=1 Tax=Penicillium arizonense TaxID=1835702 RepID=A0A1F5LXZ9_PENAI|nr:hypothetical protein PENARI_c001G05191 [Penicillium arizonense]OGE58040.1 hypothetical protein PENARI_c001G05191 [Penicillium arizonense]
MKNFITLAAFAAGSNALVGRSDTCCFHLSSSGGASGELGQLSDGQNRIGDSTLSAAQYCIDSKGAITDNKGRGCILTPPTTQLQCDEGATPTPGFSINSNGKLVYDSNTTFFACETGQRGGMNVYTTNSTDVTQCTKVELTADSCSGSGSGSGSGSSSGTGASSSAPVVQSSFGSSSMPTAPATATSGGFGPGGSASWGSTPAGSGSGSQPTPGPSSAPGASGPSASPLSGSPQTVMTTVTVTDCSCTASGLPGSPGGAPGGGGSGAQPSGPAGGSQPSGSAPAPSGGGGGAQPSQSAPAPSGGGGGVHPSGSATPAPSGGGSTPSQSGSQSPSGGGSKPTGSASASVPASSASSTPSASKSSSGSCPTNLNSGDYQYPHLIIPVDSTKPNDAAGTSYNGTVSSTVSTAFNFDIPQSYAGKTCSLVFLFPQKQDLETTDFSFSGDGKVDFAKLSSAVNNKTTSSNLPSVSQDLGDITVSPGNGYVVSTFSCPAGTTVAYEMKNAGSTNLNWFNDWNPSPLGLFITTC